MTRHKDAFSGNKKVSYNKQSETFNKKSHKISGSSSFNKNQKRVTSKGGFFLFFPASKRDRDNGSFGSKNYKRRSKGNLEGRNQRVSKRKTNTLFSNSNKGENRFGKDRLKHKGTFIFNKDKRMVVSRKRFFFFTASHKREPESTSYGSKQRQTKGSYAFNAKKKRVEKKKFLFIFNRHAKEKETSSFSGGKTRRFFKFNVFSKKKKTTVHRNGIFRRSMDKKTRRKKNLGRDLFNPRMGIKI